MDFVKAINGMKKDEANAFITSKLQNGTGTPITPDTKAIAVKASACELQVGDIFKIQTMSGHRGIVLSIKGDKCCYVMLTTDNTFPGIICPVLNSRVVKGYFTSTISEYKCGGAWKEFVCPYDNKKQLREVRRILKERWKTILR
jgi:hypothetical protein